METCVRCGKSYQSSSGDIEGLCNICKPIVKAEQQGLSAGNAGYASEAVPACGHCKYFILNTYEDEFKSEMGNCKYEVKFPDSTFARCAGTKKTMNKKDGRYCPCYESKPEA